MIRDILVNLEHEPAHDAARDFAISVAESLDAHLAGVSFAYLSDLPSRVMAQFPPDVIAEMIAQSEKVASVTIDRFDAAVARSQLSTERRLLRASGGEAPEVLAILLRRFDLGVIMQSDPDGPDNDDMIETMLFQSGRPVIVVPYIQKNGLSLDRVVCCWDGSRAAARALNDALPLLGKSRAVDLLIALNEKTNTDESRIRGAEMAKHLARHEIKVTIETTPAADIDVASAILSYVADNSASLIVMGGYGHTRLRELILGGVTRDMLKSMTVPVLMSH